MNIKNNPQVVVYPSGFIGYDVGWPVVKSQEETDVKNLLARSTLNVKNTEWICNRSIEILFHEWNTKSRKLSDARFLSDLLSAACNAFGTTSFYEWVHIQDKNPYLTSYHRQFLNETMDLIFKGQVRPSLLPNWSGLLKPVEASSVDRKVVLKDDYYLSLVGKEQMTVLEVVQKWSSAPSGLTDMLYSLHLIFGDAKI